MLISSTNLTFEKWTGRVGCIGRENVDLYVAAAAAPLENSAPTRPIKLLRATSKTDDEKDSNMTIIRYMTGITRVKWSLDNQHFLAASELGHIELFKVSTSDAAAVDTTTTTTDTNEKETTKTNPNPGGFVFDSIMYAKEHESLINCLETRLDGPLVLTGSHDSK